MTFDQTRSQIEQRLADMFDRDRYPDLSFSVAAKGSETIEVHVTVSGPSGMSFGTVASPLHELDPLGMDALIALVARKARELIDTTE